MSENDNRPIYDLDDAVKTIKKHFPLLSKRIIKKVLCGNDFYLKQIGCLDVEDQDIIDTYR